MNHLKIMIEELRKEQGLSLLEEFKLLYAHNREKYGTLKWRFTENELQVLSEMGTWTRADDMTLCNLARGDYFIVVKIPFLPKKDEIYYYVEWMDDKGPANCYVTETKYDGGLFDAYNIIHNNCFRSVQEAKEKKLAMYADIAGEAGIC